MERVAYNPGLRVISVNGDTFLHCPEKLKSFNLSILRNDNLSRIINFLKKGKTTSELVEFILNDEQMHVLDKSDAINVINSLIDKSFLRTVDDKSDIEKIWFESNWKEALQFHKHTNNIPKMMYNTSKNDKFDVNTMEDYRNNEEIPSNYKTVSGDKIKLEKPLVKAKPSVTDALLGKNQVSIDLPLLSRILYYSFGEIDSRYMKVTGRHIRKTIPSGGARHPIEVYILVKESVGNIMPGLYHYDVQEHSVTLMRLADEKFIDSFIKEHLLLDENRPGFNYHLAFIYSCLYERSMFRYRESRSYRVMQFDLGHVTQNLNFIARAYGINMYNGYSCHESSVEELLGLDSYLESCVGYTVV